MINFNVKYLLLMDTANDVVKGSGGLRLKRILAQAIARPPRWMIASEKGNLAIAIQQAVKIGRFSIEKLRASETNRANSLDPGTSDLFSSRLQETVYQLGQTNSGSYNPRKQPDRVHGLQRTSNFESLLQEPYAHDEPQQNRRLIEDVVKTSMNVENGGEPILFPFLVLEAKGEKSPQNFEHMEIQTAFPIKNALQLQYDLLKTKGNTMDVPGGP